MGARPAVAWLVAALLLPACDVSAPLAWLGHPHIRELTPGEAASWIGDERNRVVQLRSPDDSAPALPGVLRMAPDEEPPPELGTPPGWVVVVATDRDGGLRLAARLAREGRRVALVPAEAGTLDELLPGAETRRAALEQRSGPAGHPSR